MLQHAPWDDNSDDEQDMDAREPWMWGGKRAFVFLIDVSEPMFEPDMQGSTHFITSIKACKKIMLKKVVQEEKDLIGIVLFGTKHKDQKGQPNHVMTLQEIESSSAEKIQELIKIEEDPDKFERTIGHSQDFCIGDGLWHCNKLLTNCKTKLFEKTILLLTSTDDPHASNPSLQTISYNRARDLRLTSISLKVVPLGLSFKAADFYKELIDAACDDSSTPQVIQTMDDILEMFEQSASKRSVGKLVWKLGEDVKMAVGIYTLCKAATMPNKVKIERTKNELVHSRVQYFNANSGEEVLRSDIVKSTKFAGEAVVYEAEEELIIKQVSPPGLVLLGFKPIAKIQIHHHLKDSKFVYPEESKITGSRTLFTALHARCLARKVCAICYLTARRSSRPELVALVPQEEKLGKNNVQLTPPGFIIVFLPFADNIRDLDQFTAKCPNPNTDLVSIVERIVDRISFDYDPFLIDNPKLSTHWAGIEALALKYPDANVPIDHTLPDKSIDRKIDALANQFMNLAFPEGFDEIRIIASGKAKHASPAKHPPKPKKVKVELDPANMENIAKDGLVEKLRVDQLKGFLAETGLRVSKMKKDELVNAVYQHFQIDQSE